MHRLKPVLQLELTPFQGGGSDVYATSTSSIQRISANEVNGHEKGERNARFEKTTCRELPRNASFGESSAELAG
jgi:hypothetical protein